MNVKHETVLSSVAWVGTIILLVSGVSLCYHRPEMQIRPGTGAGSEDIAEHHVLHPMQHPLTEVMAATRAQYNQPVPVPQPIPQPLPQHYHTQTNYPSYSIQPNQPSYPNQPNYPSQPNYSNPGYTPGYSVRHWSSFKLKKIASNVKCENLGIKCCHLFLSFVKLGWSEVSNFREYKM